MKLIVMQGAPGSGKSFKARKMQALNPHTTVIVSMDSLRDMRGVYWVPEQEEYIQDLEEYAVYRALEKGYDVIVDATNLNDKKINKWKVMATKFNIECEFIMCYATVDECIQRDKFPDRTHHVGENVIRGFFERYADKLVKPEEEEEEDEETQAQHVIGIIY